MKAFPLCVRFILLLAVFAAPICRAVDFSKPQEALQAFVKLRANLDGSDSMADWKVTVFIVEPGKRALPVMRLDGFNVGRAVKKEDGSYQWLSREVAYYRDLKTGAILDKWTNPVTGKVNDVVQVVNDPVNGLFAADRMNLPWDVRGEDVFVKMDIPLAYPNALQAADYPDESTGPTYFATEHFLYAAKVRDFDDPKLSSVPVTYSWFRTGPWLPWMKMGQRPGYLLYSGQGKKLRSASELDPVVRETTEKQYPLFMKAPDQAAGPNETSWTYYRKLNPPKGAAASEKK